MPTHFPIVAVGELAIGRPLLDSSGRPHAAEFQAPLDALQSADLVYGHLEAPLRDTGFRQEKAATLSSPPSIAEEYRRLGLDILSIGSNHALDYGYDGLYQTVDVLQAAGIGVFGAGRTLDEAAAPHVASVAGRRVAFLNVCSLIPHSSAATPHRPGIAPLRITTRFEIEPNILLEQPGTAPTVRTAPVPADLEATVARIQAARAEADVVIVCPHWGVGGQLELTEYQRTLGHAFIDAGADLVLGTHPHVLQGIERYRDRYIFYNLGEFVIDYHLPFGYLATSDQNLPPILLDLLSRMRAQGLVVGIDFDSAGALTFALRPVQVTDQGHCVFLSGVDRDAVLTHLQRQSTPLDTTLTFTPADDWLRLS